LIVSLNTKSQELEKHEATMSDRRYNNRPCSTLSKKLSKDQSNYKLRLQDDAHEEYSKA